MLKIDWIDPNILAASSIPVSLADLETLNMQGIRAILTLTEHPLTDYKEITPDALERLGLQSLHIPVNDQYAPSTKQVAEAIQFIERMKQASKPVLVHCHAGIGRTGTMLHGYFLNNGSPLEEAKLKVKRAKPSSQWLMLSDAPREFLTQYASAITESKE